MLCPPPPTHTQDADFVDFNWCEYKHEDHDKAVQEEDDIIEKMRHKRKQRQDHLLHFEGDTEVKKCA